ncbi:SPOR domain-containing protein [Nitrosospira sp. Is2]|uniref:SPOR domain-containing protein n=1 Tax=Nitrosospira sp. Is2 TaxID=3080532 RepID=UPI002954D5F1|nr:SPOR domain-containing protein [Nitrosospira sp. Is2]WON72743.1 SPOR domain-containing protein [Nitrosospira sp. Is2]
MSRDYKTRPNSSVFGKDKNALLLGVFIGYALGLLSAIGTWMYINKSPSPFISHERPRSTETMGAVNQPEKKVGGGEDGGGKAPDGKPRFEFYKILPNSEEPVTDQQLKQPAQRPSVHEKYFLQAGSFQKSEDADNLKAKLAMIGVEATVQAADLAGKGMWHRVRVGPFSSTDDMNKVRASLQQNGVPSSIIKVNDAVQ